MKKNVLVSAAVLALGAGSMLLTGFDSAATVDDVIANYTEASKNLEACNASADMDMQIDVGVASDTMGADITMNMKMAGNLDISYLLDPLSVSVSGSFQVNAAGEEMNADMQVYLVPGDNGAWDSFTYVDDGTGGSWQYSEVPAEQMEEIQKLMEESQLNPDSFPVEYTLSEEPTEVNGSACYHLAASITYDVLQSVMEEAMATAASEELDEETMAIVESMLSGMVFNMDMDVDAESYLPLQASINMDGSDFSAFAQLMGTAFATTDSDGNVVIPDVTLEIPTMIMNFTYDYSTPAEITVPAEALESKENPGNIQDIADALDTLDELESDAE